MTTNPPAPNGGTLDQAYLLAQCTEQILRLMERNRKLEAVVEAAQGLTSLVKVVNGVACLPVGDAGKQQVFDLINALSLLEEP